MAPDTFMIILTFIFGLILGSFLNVCIHRIPIKKSIVTPSSACPQCGKGIRFYDNIPLISYMILKGRCRHCNEPISIQYPLVELITGLLSISLFIRYHLNYLYLLFLFFSASLVVVSFIDLGHRIIPDVITIPGMAIGVIISFFSGHIEWHDSIIGMIGGGGLLKIVAIVFKRVAGKEGMGDGDIRLLAMIGAWMGWRPIPFILLAGSLTGLLLGGGTLLIRGKSLGTKIPFGPFLALGALVYLLFGRDIISWYFRLLV